MTYNKIYAVIGEERHIVLDPINYQYDVKQILVISGETLPEYYEADICNVGDTATLTMIGTAADGVEIPDKFLLDGRNVLVYVVIPGSGGDVQTRYDITIPVDERAEREDIDPSEAEQQQIDSLINALNSGVGRAETAATAAEESATDAEGSAGEAEDQAENAEAWAVGQRAGEDVPDTDPTYHNNSKYYAGMAEAAAEEAGQHEASWETWVQRAETAAGNAESSATAAGQSKTDAEAAAQTATQKATEAGNSAAAAAGSAASARQTVDGAIGAINEAKEGAVTQIGSAGSNAVASVNQAGTTQTGRVTNEGNTQVNRVQTKGDEVLDSIPQDYSDLVDDVADLTRQLSDETTGLDTKAPVIFETASGAIASFDDGADSMPVKKLVAQIEPVQAAGTPSPENPLPISGWTGAEVTNAGKNLLDVDSIGEIKSTQSNTRNGVYITKPGTYTIKAHDSYSNAQLSSKIKSKSGVYGSSTVIVAGGMPQPSVTYTIEDGDTLIIFDANTSSLNTSKSVFLNTKVQLELGSTATAYEPYSGNQISVNWEEEADTVYGGTLTLNPDSTGTLVVERAIVDLGTLAWIASIASPGQYYSETNFGAKQSSNIICTSFKYGNAYAGTEDNTIELKIGTYHRTWIKSSVYSGLTASEFKNAMSGVILCYELNSPQTYQLTAEQVSGILTTLHGTNNIWSSTGDTEVTYPADTKLFIEKLTQPTEDDMTADHAISAGTFFMLGNTLYLATSQIAAGGTITPGTNATKLSLADALNTLNT